MIQLNDQVRAADDVQQMETILNLRRFNGNNVSDKLLKTLRHNNTLTKNDFINEETQYSLISWYSAPLAVTSNTERDNLMLFRAEQWAQNNGVPIITWHIQCTGAIMNYSKDSYTEKEIYHKQSGLLSYFVQGAMSYITENINPKKDLANGTTVFMHSLTFSEEDKLCEDHKVFLNQIKLISHYQENTSTFTI